MSVFHCLTEKILKEFHCLLVLGNGISSMIKTFQRFSYSRVNSCKLVILFLKYIVSKFQLNTFKDTYYVSIIFFSVRVNTLLCNIVSVRINNLICNAIYNSQLEYRIK